MHLNNKHLPYILIEWAKEKEVVKDGEKEKAKAKDVAKDMEEPGRETFAPAVTVDSNVRNYINQFDI